MTEELHRLNPSYRKGYQPWMKKKRRRSAFKGIVNMAPAEPKINFNLGRNER